MMSGMDESLPALNALIEQRLAVVRRLAESLEISQSALVNNDAEAIARGAAHQAELCRQWSRLEEELRNHPGRPGSPSEQNEPSARFQEQWNEISARIRYLTRVHWSLLRHLERSMTVLERVVASCAPTYVAGPHRLSRDMRAHAGE